MKVLRRTHIFIALALVIIMLMACAREKIPEEEIVAKVGDMVITAEEFKYAYEFSPSPVRTGPDPRMTFLNYLIKEKLLALEGYEKGFHKSPYVRRRMRHRRYLDLLEAAYLKHVHQKVKISEEELRDAILKGTVQFRLRIWPIDDAEKAQQAYAEAKRIGLREYMKKQFARQDIPLDQEKNYVTDWIDFLEVRPEILDGIKDLEVGDVSEPLPFHGGYALFQVMDIQRVGIKEDDLKYGVKRKRMEDRLHNIKADSIVHAFMDSVLTPLDIRVKSRVVDQLAPLLYAWIQDRLPFGISLLEALEEPDTTKAYLEDLKNLLDETLVTYKGGQKTVRDYLLYMDYFRRNLKGWPTLDEFKVVLITEIGRMMKNDVFVEIAEKEGFEDSTNIATDLRLWEQKWTYDAYRQHLVKDISISEEELREFFDKHWRELPVADVDSTKFESYRIEAHAELLHRKHIARLEEELEELKKKYPIWINEQKLADMDLLDRDKARNISLFVVKRFSHQAVVPTVDLKWIAF